MKLDERIGAEPIVSFEFSPPRTVEAELAFWGAIDTLAALEPAFVSVTCGAGGTTRDLTLAVVRRLARERALEAVPHVTATGFTRDGLVALLSEARAGGADNVLALRGDPPRGEATWRAPVGGVQSSLELIAFAADAGFCVLGAAYPEPHPDSRGWAEDLAHLRAKLDAGVRVLVTQLFFDNDDYRRFLDRLRAANIDVPVLPGIIPIASIGQIERMTALCGARIPDALRRELESSQDDPRAVAELGVAYATAQAAELLQEGAPGVHLYTLNRSPATRAIVSALRAHGALPVTLYGVLDGLDAVDWSSIRHCYGPATDVPEQLRALASQDPDRRKWARHQLFSNILHQGGTYEASAYAVPFLLELVAEPATQERPLILLMLDGMTVGEDDWVLPEGVRPGFEEIPAYRAVREGVPLFRTLLWDGDNEIEAQAAKLLAWFPHEADGSLEALWARLEKAPQTVAGACLAAIGLLGGRHQNERLAPLLTDDDPYRRWGAAIALARIAGREAPDPTLEVLLDAATGDLPDGTDQGVEFDNGDMPGYAIRSLCLLGPRGLDAMLEALPGCERLVHGVVPYAFPERIDPDTPFAELTEDQQRTARDPAFRLGRRLAASQPAAARDSGGARRLHPRREAAPAALAPPLSALSSLTPSSAPPPHRYC